MKDDRGFTLVELIVVMAIMGVVITFGVIKSEVLFSYNAQECYKKVMSTLKTEKVQVLAHSTMIGSMDVAKSDGSVSDDVKNYGVYIEFYVDGNSIYTKTYVKGTAKEEKGSKVAGKGVTILYKLAAGVLLDLFYFVLFYYPSICWSGVSPADVEWSIAIKEQFRQMQTMPILCWDFDLNGSALF